MARSGILEKERGKNKDLFSFPLSNYVVILRGEDTTVPIRNENKKK